ncbi:DegT/DnrJ/EryC1/StrS aminotransferase family protein [Akkermansiaceae bacterium]|nr:DegT/DnrJ/EryC1/StrS aminotransferase family protein [Akkermansiaceae bacterium]
MKDFIPLASPDIRDEDIKATVDVLTSGMLVQGQQVLALESQTRSFLNTRSQILACANGTATMHMALVAAGVGVGDEVIVPAFSYVATANVVELVGATPVFVDIDIRTFNIDVSQIKAAITDKTKVIIPVHEFGLMCDIEGIMRIANDFDLLVIEDAACALGATYKGRFAGTFGDFGSFSLHPRKAITSGEGGLLVVRDESQAQTISALRSHGMVAEGGSHEFILPGFNYRMTDIQAALVGSQMSRINQALERRRHLASVYNEFLNEDLFVKPLVSDGCEHSWQSYHIMLKPHVDRSDLQSYLKDRAIGSSYGAQCIPAQKYYLEEYQLDSEKSYPNAYRAWKAGLCLPLYEKLDDSNIKSISKILNEYV